MEPTILVKYASRSRPSRFKEGLESIYTLACDPAHVHVHCVLDEDDPFVEQYKETIPSDNRHLSVHFGISQSKVDAINRPFAVSWWKKGAVMPYWDILVNFSDDMKFTVYGWDHLVREGVRCNGPDVFLHYPDSTAKNMLPTMSIMDRTYYERDNYIYHPSYKSLWCDNEAMDVAKMRGRYHYMGIQIYDHFHPAYGHVPWDAQYERQQKFWDEDEKNYYDRKKQNFYLDAAELVDPYCYGAPVTV
jgi:hypothetical protein